MIVLNGMIPLIIKEIINLRNSLHISNELEVNETNIHDIYGWNDIDGGLYIKNIVAKPFSSSLDKWNPPSDFNKFTAKTLEYTPLEFFIANCDTKYNKTIIKAINKQIPIWWFKLKMILI